MEEVINIEQEIWDKVKTLPPEKQQQVLDFVEFLHQLPQQEFKHADSTSISVLEAAGDLIGCVEGPGDLSLKKRELKGHKAE